VERLPISLPQKAFDGNLKNCKSIARVKCFYGQIGAHLTMQSNHAKVFVLGVKDFSPQQDNYSTRAIRRKIVLSFHLS
jgi:hypothetical protein